MICGPTAQQPDFGGIDGLINDAGVTRDSLLVKVHEGKVVAKMSVDGHGADAGFRRGVVRLADVAFARDARKC